MTDAQFPERGLNDRRILRLPDEAFRLFVISLAWSVANRTDGRIYDDDLALIPASAAGSGQLAKVGLWERVADYWQIAEFEETQTTRADLDHLAEQRRKARDRKRAERARRARRGQGVPRDARRRVVGVVAGFDGDARVTEEVRVVGHAVDHVVIAVEHLPAGEVRIPLQGRADVRAGDVDVRMAGNALLLAITGRHRMPGKSGASMSCRPNPGSGKSPDPLPGVPVDERQAKPKQTAISPARLGVTLQPHVNPGPGLPPYPASGSAPSAAGRRYP